MAEWAISRWDQTKSWSFLCIRLRLRLRLRQAVNASLSAWINKLKALVLVSLSLSLSPCPVLSHSQHMLTTWWPKVKWLKCPAHCKQTASASYRHHKHHIHRKQPQATTGYTKGQNKNEGWWTGNERKPNTEGQPRMQIQANKIIIQIFGMSHER